MVPSLETLREALALEIDRLDKAAERWLEDKAAGEGTEAAEAEISSIDTTIRRLERQVQEATHV